MTQTVLVPAVFVQRPRLCLLVNSGLVGTPVLESERERERYSEREMILYMKRRFE